MISGISGPNTSIKEWNKSGILSKLTIVLSRSALSIMSSSLIIPVILAPVMILYSKLQNTCILKI